MAKDEMLPLDDVCRHCGNPIEQKPTGRRRLFCDDACRVNENRKDDMTQRRYASPGRCWCEKHLAQQGTYRWR